LITSNGYAHGAMDWNDFTMDNKTAGVLVSIDHLNKVIADIVMARRPVPLWPDPELMAAQRDVIDLQDELEDMLVHFREDGIDTRIYSVLHTHPRAGRAVATLMALEAAENVLSYIISTKDKNVFAAELEQDGIPAYMLDLLDAYVEQIALYSDLVKQAPAFRPALQPAGQ
jgi:hypothetical protein